MKWTNLATIPLAKAKSVFLNLRLLGLRGTFKLYSYRIRETYRDRQLGIRTEGYIAPEALGHRRDCAAYEPINYRCLDVICEYLQPNVNDVILDYGCGKGRAMIAAAMYPFRRVIGIELSQELSAAAQQNAERALPKLTCRDLEIITADAATHEVPADVNIIFLFNPFEGEVLAAVQQKIRESIRLTPRQVRVVYLYPPAKFSRNELDYWTWLTPLTELPTADWHDVKLVIYESNELSTEQDAPIFATIGSE